MSSIPRKWHKSIRLPDFDYSSPSTYFFTQCTAGRTCYLGEIDDGEMYLTRTGVRVWQEWDRTLHLRPTIIEHAFIVMPNHIHGLVSFTEHGVSPLVASHSNATNPFHRKPRSLGSMMSGFKGAVTRWLQKELDDLGFGLWQDGYHEHIVPNEKAFETIQGYIMNNVERWEEDRENPANWNGS